MPLPNVDLFINTNQLPTVNCSGWHPSSPCPVKATLPPAYCHHRGNNVDPHAG
ncbi:hypothetical protein PF002_g23546 [Phytophthora fragariae]|uniref:Uncharacterized protein n=1 Tax=Phytophthora fragariae TaxID=53985 RepID=A0A6A3X3T8_9STRA|nr:hypothetical protein PF003_g33385 [Phytophthora fragariae]KAE9194624.1 hypothetical protein PF002_g23546 [Phytophthora fragariae]